MHEREERKKSARRQRVVGRFFRQKLRQRLAWRLQKGVIEKLVGMERAEPVKSRMCFSSKPA